MLPWTRGGAWFCWDKMKQTIIELFSIVRPGKVILFPPVIEMLLRVAQVATVPSEKPTEYRNLLLW